ncbi:MAG: UDP binding domain-containing protein [Candidatus Methanoperedens sp.]|nr:UDP binding domain-containing protein [Candidatus Methanoperedens sp.]
MSNMGSGSKPSEKFTNKSAVVCVVGLGYVDLPTTVGFAEKDVYTALDGGDALVLMTAHREFRELDLRRVKERMRTPIIIDGRRVFDQSHASGGRVHVNRHVS